VATSKRNHDSDLLAHWQAELEKVCGPVDTWASRCHEVSTALVGVVGEHLSPFDQAVYAVAPVRARVVRGYWLGPVHRTSPFAGRGIVQHSWVRFGEWLELGGVVPHVLDPTGWAITGGKPGIFEGPEFTGLYDAAGDRCAMGDLDRKLAMVLAAPEEKQGQLAVLGDLDIHLALCRYAKVEHLRRWVLGCFANASTVDLPVPAADFYAALVRSEQEQLVPIDRLELVLGAPGEAERQGLVRKGYGSFRPKAPHFTRKAVAPLRANEEGTDG
jgi:hypothetical protein